MKNKSLAILTVCKNSSNTIEKLFESVRINKDFINEFIVIDGLSNDNTLDLIINNNDIITYFISEKDKGISDAFNKGISFSTSDFILIVNSDDFLYKKNIKHIINCLDFSDDLISTPLLMLDNDLENIYISNLKNIKKYTSVYHPGLIVNRLAYLKYGIYDLNYHIGMDYDFICRAYKFGANFKTVNIPIVVFSEGGVSSKRYYKSVIEGYLIRKKHFNIWFPDYEIYKLALKFIGISINLIGLKKIFKPFKYKIYKILFT